jgi:hypothetical protein
MKINTGANLFLLGLKNNSFHDRFLQLMLQSVVSFYHLKMNPETLATITITHCKFSKFRQLPQSSTQV